MYGLNLADNITRLRHERRITQEELADFLGVTKAAVSKWENAQSTPELLIVLELATFFDVTVDSLLGYEPQLSREQIRRRYGELSEDFANLPFDEALGKVRELAHRYYSCYPFLLQLSIIYWNHFMLADTREEQVELLCEAVAWCDHILENCGDVGVCGNALVVKAGLSLQLGRPQETIALLEPTAEPSRLSGQDGGILVQAYQMAGKKDKARSYVQARQYLGLLNMVVDGMLSLALYENDLPRCEETIRRMKGIMREYRLEALHPNVAAQFYFQSAVAYGVNEKWEGALEALGGFERCVSRLMEAEQITLHGDEYFDLLDEWIERLPLGNMAPRDRSFIRKNVGDALKHPAFAGMKERKEFQRLIRLFAN